MIRARIYCERPDWWLHVYRDAPRVTYYHRRFWRWADALDAVPLVMAAARTGQQPVGCNNPVCDGKCR